jgi:hypothetical protein
VGTFVASSSCAAAMMACSLDWAVRSDPGASPESGGDVADARSGDDSDAATSSDAPMLVDSAYCMALAAEVARTKTKARECQLVVAGQCTTSVKDECECDVVVRFAGAVATTDYANAIGALRAACEKSLACKPCPQLPLMGSWKCLQQGLPVECYP